MHISRIQIHNYRNFAQFDVRLGPQAVIVGENGIGKSNLLHALRLLLDPSLPDSSRQLRAEDFWDGIPHPLTKDDRIQISVDLADFDGDEHQLALLADHLIESKPMVARLTFVFQALPTLKDDPTKDSDYEFFIYGGDRPDNKVGYEVRLGLPLDVLPALRDAEGDLANWRRSPLRPLLDSASSQVDRAAMKAIADGIAEATEAIEDIPQIEDLVDRINDRLEEMVGPQALETALGFSPTDPDKLVRALRLFFDDQRRGISEASLGFANLLYLTLKSLEVEQSVSQGAREHTFLAIEEPEAHLHPHLQRLVYREFLRPRTEGATLEGEGAKAHLPSPTSVLLTTHSPHVVSVSPLKSLVLLRRTADGKSTEGVSTAPLDLTEAEVDDLERYLDVTRGEMLFAKGIILVEGDAELFLVPKLADGLGIEFDRLGITVCSVSGTHFASYVKLLGPNGLGIPLAVITDGDPRDTGDLGTKRAIDLLPLVAKAEELEGKKEAALLKLAQERGLFVGEHTFEVDLFRCGRHGSITETLANLGGSIASGKRALAWMKNPGTLDVEQFLRDITAIGKGRFAQRLSTRMAGSKACPSYVQNAIKYVASRCE